MHFILMRGIVFLTYNKVFLNNETVSDFMVVQFINMIRSLQVGLFQVYPVSNTYFNHKFFYD